MANAKRDENRVPGIIGVSSIDGETTTPVKVEPTSQSMYVMIVAQDIASGNYYPVQGQFDENGNFVLLTNGTGGITPVTKDGYWNSTNTNWDDTSINWDQT